MPGCQDPKIVKVVCKVVKRFYFEHNCVEMLIVVKRLMPTKSGHCGIRDLMLEYLVGIPNVFRA